MMRPLTHIALRSLRGLPRRSLGALGWEGGPQAIGGSRGIRKVHPPDVPSPLGSSERCRWAPGPVCQRFRRSGLRIKTVSSKSPTGGRDPGAAWHSRTVYCSRFGGIDWTGQRTSPTGTSAPPLLAFWNPVGHTKVIRPASVHSMTARSTCLGSRTNRGASRTDIGGSCASKSASFGSSNGSLPRHRK